MPHPKSVRNIRSFNSVEEREAYAEGLLYGANALSQPGSDPWRVRREDDHVSDPPRFIAYLQLGYYADNGEEIFE